jgi:hypothetical protein
MRRLTAKSEAAACPQRYSDIFQLVQREYLGVGTINSPDTKNGRAFVLP